MENKITLKNGEQTEELLQFILDNFSDEELDNIEVDRKLKESAGFASEPITTAATIITVSGAFAVTLVRLIERWFESKRQKDQMTMVIEAFKQSPEAGTALAKLAEKNNDVSINYGLTKKTDIK